MKTPLYLLAFVVLIISCSKKGDSPGPDPVTPSPVAAVLNGPVKDEECTSGAINSATESTIPFSWKSAANTESYEISIKNLESNAVITQTTSNTNLDIRLQRNTPYSWFVTSKSSKTTATAKSEVWKFYNSGPGTGSYAPFPAEAVNPLNGALVTPVSGKVTLDWNASDVDNDISNYDVFMGTGTLMPVLRSNISESIVTGVDVNANTTYYWKVITKDAKGNTSDSEVWQFRTK